MAPATLCKENVNKDTTQQADGNGACMEKLSRVSSSPAHAENRVERYHNTAFHTNIYIWSLAKGLISFKPDVVHIFIHSVRTSIVLLKARISL